MNQLLREVGGLWEEGRYLVAPGAISVIGLAAMARQEWIEPSAWLLAGTGLVAFYVGRLVTTGYAWPAFVQTLYADDATYNDKHSVLLTIGAILAMFIPLVIEMLLGTWTTLALRMITGIVSFGRGLSAYMAQPEKKGEPELGWGWRALNGGYNLVSAFMSLAVMGPVAIMAITFLFSDTQTVAGLVALVLYNSFLPSGVSATTSFAAASAYPLFAPIITKVINATANEVAQEAWVAARDAVHIQHFIAMLVILQHVICYVIAGEMKKAEKLADVKDAPIEPPTEAPIARPALRFLISVAHNFKKTIRFVSASARLKGLLGDTDVNATKTVSCDQQQGEADTTATAHRDAEISTATAVYITANQTNADAIQTHTEAIQTAEVALKRLQNLTRELFDAKLNAYKATNPGTDRAGFAIPPTYKPPLNQPFTIHRHTPNNTIETAYVLVVDSNNVPCRQFQNNLYYNYSGTPPAIPDFVYTVEAPLDLAAAYAEIPTNFSVESTRLIGHALTNISKTAEDLKQATTAKATADALSAKANIIACNATGLDNAGTYDALITDASPDQIQHAIAFLKEQMFNNSDIPGLDGNLTQTRFEALFAGYASVDVQEFLATNHTDINTYLGQLAVANNYEYTPIESINGSLVPYHMIFKEAPSNLVLFTQKTTLYERSAFVETVVSGSLALFSPYAMFKNAVYVWWAIAVTGVLSQLLYHLPMFRPPYGTPKTRVISRQTMFTPMTYVHIASNVFAVTNLVYQLNRMHEPLNMFAKADGTTGATVLDDAVMAWILTLLAFTTSRTHRTIPFILSQMFNHKNESFRAEFSAEREDEMSRFDKPRRPGLRTFFGRLTTF